ncbi:MAG TPA: DUF2318 domain-containing protein [Desulfomonilaceae bacterium]|nr:DUF2318 domain-containing protein [Desulfomonilaceae bacterium]
MRQKYCGEGFLIVVAIIASTVAVITFAAVSGAFAWNFSVPAQEVQPANGIFAFPAAAFQDGKAKYFQYSPSPNQKIRFFVVKSVDGVIRAAFDACEVCWRAKKGYVQQGNEMICVNCGLKFRTDKVNEVTGGCNPSALKRTVQDGKVVITQQDVMSGLRYFQ